MITKSYGGELSLEHLVVWKNNQKGKLLNVKIIPSIKLSFRYFGDMFPKNVGKRVR